MTTTSEPWTAAEVAARLRFKREVAQKFCAEDLAFDGGYFLFHDVRRLAFLRGDVEWLQWTSRDECAESAPWFSRAGRARKIAASVGWQEGREVSEREAIAIDRIRLATGSMCEEAKSFETAFEVLDVIERELREILRIHVSEGEEAIAGSIDEEAGLAYRCLRKVKRIAKRTLSGSDRADVAVVLLWRSIFRLACSLSHIGPDLDPWMGHACDNYEKQQERMRKEHEKRYGSREERECRDDRIWEEWLKIRRLKKVSKTAADKVVAKLSPFSEMTVKRARSKREKEKLDREKLGH